MYIKQNSAISYFNSNFKLEIKESGYALCDSSWDIPDVSFPYSRLYYVKKGEAQLFYAGEEVILTAGKLYFVPLGISFSYNCDVMLEKLYFHINIPSAEKFDLFWGYKEIISFDTDHFDELIKLYDSNNICDLLRLNSILYTDIVEILKYIGVDNITLSSYSSLVCKAIEYINNNLSIKLSIKEIADHLYISESKLSKTFRSEVGVSLGKYVDYKVIFEIEKLLVETDIPISEICEMFGFNDLSYMLKSFKIKTKLTPSQYRKKIKMANINYYGLKMS